MRSATSCWRRSLKTTGAGTGFAEHPDTLFSERLAMSLSLLSLSPASPLPAPAELAESAPETGVDGEPVAFGQLLSDTLDEQTEPEDDEKTPVASLPFFLPNPLTESTPNNQFIDSAKEFAELRAMAASQASNSSAEEAGTEPVFAAGLSRGFDPKAAPLPPGFKRLMAELTPEAAPTQAEVEGKAELDREPEAAAQLKSLRTDIAPTAAKSEASAPLSGKGLPHSGETVLPSSAQTAPNASAVMQSPVTERATAAFATPVPLPADPAVSVQKAEVSAVMSSPAHSQLASDITASNQARSGSSEADGREKFSSSADPFAEALKPLLPNKVVDGAVFETNLSGTAHHSSSVSSATPSATVSVPATTVNAQTATQLPLPLAHPTWGDAMAQRVVWFAQQHFHHAEIQLNPADLGPIEIKLALQNGEASVAFNAAHASTRDALEQALPRLRDMFQQQGLQLGQVQVGGDTDRGARQWTREAFLPFEGKAAENGEHESELGASAPRSDRSARSVDYYA